VRPRPPGYPTLSPYLIVPEAEGVIRFMTEVFGAREVRRFPSPDGGILHAEVRIDDSMVMLGESGGGDPPPPPAPAPAHRR